MDTSGKRTRKTALARREEILAAAMRLFARQGYARTTTREIAQEAGISEGTIYRYFSSKQEILFAFSVPAIITPLHELLDQMADADDLTVLRALILNRFKLWKGQIIMGPCKPYCIMMFPFGRHLISLVRRCH